MKLGHAIYLSISFFFLFFSFFFFLCARLVAGALFSLSFLIPVYSSHKLTTLISPAELASDEDEINEDDVEYIEDLANRVTMTTGSISECGSEKQKGKQNKARIENYVVFVVGC